MQASMSLTHIVCRQGAINGVKHLNWNNVKKLHHVAACSYTQSYNNHSQLFQNTKSMSLNIPHRNKGHAHWQNIQHIKAAKDQQKLKKIQNYNNQLKGAISAYGPNPETNLKLKKILESMKNSALPKADIKRYFENATKRANSSSVEYFEARGPRGSIFVLEIETDNVKSARATLNGLMKKTSAKVSDFPSYQNFFDIKGTIEVPITGDMSTSSMDEYLEVAIEAGAEDVIMTRSVEGDETSDLVLKFHCDPKTLTTVAREIEETHNLEIESSKVILYPHTWVTIDSDAEYEACSKIAEKMQQHPEYVALFDNITVPED